MASRTYKGQAALGKRLGVSQPRVAKLVRDDDWRWGMGPWTEDAAGQIERWLGDRRAGNNATSGDIAEAAEDGDDAALRAILKNPERRARVKMMIEKTALIKLTRELKAGGFVPKDDVQKMLVTRAFSLRAKMQEIPLRASLITHKTEAECERILTDWIREVCEYYANGGN